MKGLLHRLAERAAGTAALLRPDARLPYVGLPTVTATPAGADAPAPAGQPEPAPHVAAEPPMAAAMTGQPGLAAAGAAAMMQPRPHGHRESAGLPSDTPLPLPMRPPAGGPLADTMRQARPATPQPLHAPSPAAAAAVRHPFSWDEPAPLVAPGTPGEAVPVPSLRPSTPAMQAPAEPTEVHVHIGRIEVTALHEPPAPRRPAPPRTAPVSLQAYLATKGKA